MRSQRGTSVFAVGTIISIRVLALTIGMVRLRPVPRHAKGAQS